MSSKESFEVVFDRPWDEARQKMMSDFKFNVVKSPLVCSKCGKPAWFHAVSTLPGGQNVTYCTVCLEATTLREVTEEEKTEAQKRILEEFKKWLNKPVF